MKYMSKSLCSSLKQNTGHPQFKGGKMYCSSLFVKVSFYTLMVLRHDSMVEGRQRRETVHGRKGRKQQAVALSLTLSLILSKLQVCWMVPRVPRMGLPIIHAKNCAKAISELIYLSCILNTYGNNLIQHYIPMSQPPSKNSTYEHMRIWGTFRYKP